DGLVVDEGAVGAADVADVVAAAVAGLLVEFGVAGRDLGGVEAGGVGGGAGDAQGGGGQPGLLAPVGALDDDQLQPLAAFHGPPRAAAGRPPPQPAGVCPST